MTTKPNTIEEGQPTHPTRYHHMLSDGRVQCDLCPRECKLQEGQRGLCFVRGRKDDAIVLTTYGRSSGFCIDPIEKKPLAHFYPGTAVFSFGTAGCNLTCKFCQNWDISKSREIDTLADSASPAAIAQAAKQAGAKSVAFTYNDPVIFMEYAIDTAIECHALGLKTVAVTAGYIHEEPRREFFEHIDAANIDLKAFTDSFYRELTGARLESVLDTIEYVAKETSTWLELTTLLIPGKNDSDDEIRQLATWVREHAGREVPLHFSAFHPDYKMRDVPPTPSSTLQRARAIAKDVGLAHVYTGNVHDIEGDTTFCAKCNTKLIERDWYELLAYRLDSSGACPSCGEKLAGHFDKAPGSMGRRRQRVLMHTQ